MGTSALIGPSQAVERATTALQNLLGPAAAHELLLEEIELVREKGNVYWAVTLSMPNRTTQETALRALGNLAQAMGAREREYKVFRIDAESGELISMKIRSV